MIQTLAARIAAVQAVTGRTSAESRVYDSAISAIDDLVADEPKPVVIISIEDEQSDTEMLDILAGKRTAVMVIEVAIASKLTQNVDVDGQPGVEETITIPHTDAGLEISLGVILRQVLRALFAGETVWSNAFRDLAHNVRKVSAKRGAGAVREGVKFAARQISIEFEPFAEPQFGQAVQSGTPIHKFLAACDTDASLARIAKVLREAIAGETIPGWQALYRATGLSEDQADGIGLYPLALANNGSVPLANEVLYGADQGPINEAAADQYLPPEEEP